MAAVKIIVNGEKIEAEIPADTTLLTFLRQRGYKSAKCGCETAGCGLCTVHLDGRPVLSCSVLAVRASGHTVVTLEGLQEQAKIFGAFLADEGAEQCGFCSPGFIMSVLAMEKELVCPSEQEIKEYLSGNLCRCTGYMGQMRAVRKYLEREKQYEIGQ